MIYSFGELFHQYLYIYTVNIYIHIHIVFVPSSVSLCSPCIAFGRHATGFDAKVLQCSWVAFEKVSRPSVSRRSRLGLVLGKANFKWSPHTCWHVDIFSDIYPDIYPDVFFWHTFWWIFWHAFLTYSRSKFLASTLKKAGDVTIYMWDICHKNICPEMRAPCFPVLPNKKIHWNLGSNCWKNSFAPMRCDLMHLKLSWVHFTPASLLWVALCVSGAMWLAAEASNSSLVLDTCIYMRACIYICVYIHMYISIKINK